jgi:hypothetical protein
VTLDEDSGELRGELTVVLENLAPREGLPDVIIGNLARPPIPVGDNKMHLSVYTPWGLDEARIDDRPTLFESDRELGRRVYSSFVVVPAKGSVTIRLTLSGRLRVGDDYRLDVHRQPAVAPDEVATSLTLEPAAAPRPSDLGSVDTFPLAEDRVVERRLDA